MFSHNPTSTKFHPPKTTHLPIIGATLDEVVPLSASTVRPQLGRQKRHVGVQDAVTYSDFLVQSGHLLISKTKQQQKQPPRHSIHFQPASEMKIT